MECEECSEEYGPCEAHGNVLAQREGASCRTADELMLVYIDDALGIDPECLSPYGQSIVSECEQDLERTGERWLEDPNLADALRNVAYQVESYIGPFTYWEDGYMIVTITGGPLAD